MADATIDIESIVGEVLRRLGRSGSPTIAMADRAEHELTLPSRVVSLAALDGRLAGVRRVIVPHRAVITPAAADLLRERKIEIVPQGQPSRQPATVGNVQLAVGVSVSGNDALPRTLCDLLQRENVNVERFGGGLPSLIEQLVSQVVIGRPAVVLTDEPAAALCLANRRRDVRAALAIDEPSIDEAVRTIAANLLVVDVRGRGLHRLKTHVLHFCRQPLQVEAKYGKQLQAKCRCSKAAEAATSDS